MLFKTCNSGPVFEFPISCNPFFSRLVPPSNAAFRPTSKLPIHARAAKSIHGRQSSKQSGGIIVVREKQTELSMSVRMLESRKIKKSRASQTVGSRLSSSDVSMPSIGLATVTCGAVSQLVVTSRRILPWNRHRPSPGSQVSPAHSFRAAPHRDQSSSSLPVLLGPSVQASEHVLIDIAARVRAWRGPWRWVLHQAAQGHHTATLLPSLRRRIRTLSALARSRGSVWRWILVLRRSATRRGGCGRASSWVRFTVDVRRG